MSREAQDRLADTITKAAEQEGEQLTAQEICGVLEAVKIGLLLTVGRKASEEAAKEQDHTP